MAVVSDEAYEAVDSLPVSLHMFVEKFSDKLPQVVAVNESIYGVSSGSLVEGQLLMVYFFKKTNAVSAVVAGLTKVIPLSTTMKFSIPYDPYNNPVAAKEGYFFQSVADLIKAKTMPCVVHVGKSWRASTKNFSSISEGQVLIVKGVNTSIRKRKRLLCIDVATKIELTLEDSCNGHFNTHPTLASIDLQTLLANFKLPMNVMVNDKSGTHVNCTLTRQFVLKSIIASFCPPSVHGELPAVKELPSEVIEVISTVSIDVRMIKISQEEMRCLKIVRDALGAKLGLSLLKDVISDVSATSDSFQKQLLTSVFESDWKNDIVGANDCNYESIPCSPEKKETNLDGIFPPAIPTASRVTSGTPPPIPPRTTRIHDYPVSSGAPDVPPRIRSQTTSVKPLSSPQMVRKSESIDLQQAILSEGNPAYGLGSATNNEDVLDRLKKDNETLVARLSELEKAMILPHSPKNESKVTIIDETLDANKAVIGDYSVDQIARLLDQMTLSRYKEKFMEENIDGSMFFELDDLALKEDLGVTTRLHRIKLMAIIEGHHSVNKYI